MEEQPTSTEPVVNADGPPLRCRRIKDRVYRDPLTCVDPLRPEIIAPAEYGLFRGDTLLCRIVRTGDGWRAVVAGDAGGFGRAVSPAGLDGWRQVRAWAVRFFSEGHE
jgi:hypothetical protein